MSFVATEGHSIIPIRFGCPFGNGKPTFLTTTVKILDCKFHGSVNFKKDSLSRNIFKKNEYSYIRIQI